MQFGMCIASFDIATRYAVWYYMAGGYWSGYGSVNVEFWRKIGPAMIAGIATGWISHPFEVVREAYIADKTFPKELRKGYKSYFDALRRIPMEEGPRYLARGVLPTWTRNAMQTMFFFYFYDFYKDFTWVLEVSNDHPHELTKIFGLLFAASIGSAASYPLGVRAKNVAEFQPIEKNGKHPFDRNYRLAMKAMWYQDYFAGMWNGFSKNYYWRTMPWMFVSGWIADDLGLFTHWKNDYISGAGTNSSEDIWM